MRNILNFFKKCNNIILYLLIILLIILSIFYISYTFLKKNCRYEQLVDLLKSVNNNECSNFMNYGYWKQEKLTLLEANKKLCKLIYKKGELSKELNILDVGCGYGAQDFYWKNKNKNLKIDAIDMNEISINRAKEINKYKDIRFNVGNACNLDYKNESYDRIISLESAFHYQPRIQFLKEAYRILKKGGKLVIADILYNKNSINIFNSINRMAFSNIFDIPECNRISTNAFITQLKEIGFSVKLKDISEYTFKPYYKHFFKEINYPPNFKLPEWTFNILCSSTGYYLNNLCNGTNGFNYVIAVCEK